MNVDELFAEFRKLGAQVGDHDGQPGLFIQAGIGQIIRVNSRMLTIQEAHEYLRELKNQAQPQT